MFLTSPLPPTVVFDPKADYELYEKIKAMSEASKKSINIEAVKDNFLATYANVTLFALKEKLEFVLNNQSKALASNYFENSIRAESANASASWLFNIIDSSKFLRNEYTLFSYEMLLDPTSNENEVVELAIVEYPSQSENTSIYQILFRAARVPRGQDSTASEPHLPPTTHYKNHLEIPKGEFDFQAYSDFLNVCARELHSIYETFFQP